MSKRRARLTPSLAALLCACCAWLAPVAALAVYATGTNTRTLTHDSELRAYNVYVPASYDGLTPVPLVVDIHGLTSNKEQQQGISGWQGKANATGFLVAYPDGLGNSWNAGACCDPSSTNGVDDVGFIRAMVAAIQAEGNVDASQVFVTGLSNGGAMTHRLACEASDVFVAAAPLAFPTPYSGSFATQCNPTHTRPLLLSMGLTDVLVPYENGFFGGAVESFESWRAKNACGGAAPEEHVWMGESFCDVDLSCGAGTQVGLCSIRGSALAPPLDPFSGHILYFNDDLISLPDVIWEFFQSGSLASFDTGPPPVPAVPAAGLVARIALALAVAGSGAGWLRRRGRRRTA